MEKTDEWQGAGMEYTTEYRQYDPRLGRWMSIDLMAGAFPWQSPYVGMNDNPIALKDPEGLAAGGGGGEEDGTVKRLNIFQRIGNWLRGDGYINKANKIAAKNNLAAERVKVYNDRIVVDNSKYSKTSYYREDTDTWWTEYTVEEDTRVFRRSKSRMVLDVDGKADIGVQAGLKFSWAGVVKATADIEAVSVDLISGQGSLIDYSRDAWTYSHISEYKMRINHSVGLSLGLLPGSKPGSGEGIEIGGGIEHNYIAHKYLPISDIRTEGGVSVLAPLYKHSSGGIKSKASSTESFYGINIGAGAAFVLGIEGNIKIGIAYDKSR